MKSVVYKDSHPSRKHAIKSAKRDPNVTADTIARMIDDTINHENKQHYNKKIKESYFTKQAAKNVRVVVGADGKKKNVTSAKDIKVEDTDLTVEESYGAYGARPRAVQGPSRGRKPMVNRIKKSNNKPKNANPVAKAQSKVQMAQLQLQIAQKKKMLRADTFSDTEMEHIASVMSEGKAERRSLFNKHGMARLSNREKKKPISGHPSHDYPHEAPKKRLKFNHAKYKDHKSPTYNEQTEVVEGIATTIKNVVTGKRSRTLGNVKKHIAKQEAIAGRPAISPVSARNKDITLGIANIYKHRSGENGRKGQALVSATKWKQNLQDKTFPSFDKLGSKYGVKKESLDEQTKEISALHMQIAKVMPLHKKEAEDTTPAGVKHVHTKLAKALATERQRGVAGHWTYSRSRHAAMQDVFKKHKEFVKEELVESQNMDRLVAAISILEAKRGRPKKNPDPTGEDEANEPDQHIIMQMRKAVSLRGQHPVKFKNGDVHQVSMVDAQRALHIYANTKGADAKDNFTNGIHASKAAFHKAIRS